MMRQPRQSLSIELIMSILHEIQTEAVSPNSDIATLLRKCLILAYRLRSDELKQ